MQGAGAGIQGSLFPKLCKSAKGFGVWTCQDLRALLDSSPLTEGILRRAVVTTWILRRAEVTMWILQQQLGEFCLCFPAVSSHPEMVLNPAGMTVRSQQFLLIVSVGPAACSVEGNGSAESRTELWLMRAGPAWPGKVVVVFPVLHSSPHCIP